MTHLSLAFALSMQVPGFILLFGKDIPSLLPSPRKTENVLSQKRKENKPDVIFIYYTYFLHATPRYTQETVLYQDTSARTDPSPLAVAGALPCRENIHQRRVICFTSPLQAWTAPAPGQTQ